MSNTPPRPGSANPEPARDATVYVVDDDVSHLRSMARLLKASGFRVVIHNSAAELLAELRPDAAGCVVTDLMMPEMNGIGLQEALRRAGNPLPVVFLTGHGNVPTTVQAMKGGAEDFLTKNAPKEDLLAAIGRALERNALDRTRTASLREKRSLFESLTDREREVLRHVLQGQLNKQIAADLVIHERTVKLHRTHITTKLGVHSVAELSRLVQEAQIEL
ncbi:MAG: response regulator [Verrucomicrobia bacterium]|nr:response regulator [Verrucomicrobiota bacterium]